MGVSLDCYRQRIGAFNENRKLKKATRIKTSSKCETKANPKLYTFLLFYITLVQPNIQNPKLLVSRNDFKLFEWQQGLGGVSATETNKLCHIKYGNKNIGYDLAAWNCGRGLLTKSNHESDKLIDIKLFIQNPGK